MIDFNPVEFDRVKPSRYRTNGTFGFGEFSDSFEEFIAFKNEKGVRK